MVVDGNLVTSRRPSDLPDFTRALIGLLLTGARALFDRTLLAS